jgi:uncharacterized membrane protein (DUF106 family)
MDILTLITAYPKESIIIISFLVVLVTTIITKYVTDQKRMKELKEIQKACQIKLRDNKGNLEEMNKINSQVMECSMELMKHSFKPMLITFIPLVLLAAWMNKAFAVVLSSWIWWYILSGLVFSMILRKLLKVA